VALFKIAAENPPLDQDGPAIIDGSQPVLQPLCDGVFMDSEDPGGFLNRIAPVKLDATGIGPTFGHHTTPFSISARMSSTRHAVIRGPSFTGLG
jgi:hypothetical protein